MFKNTKSTPAKHITILKRLRQILQTREIIPSPTREIHWPISAKSARNNPATPKRSYTHKPAANSLTCPYCMSNEFVKRGKRHNQRDITQLYQCKTCHKTFTQKIHKGKHYSLKIVLKAVSLYNLGYSLQQVCDFLNQKPSAEAKNLTLNPATISRWLEQFSDKLPFLRMRPFLIKNYSPREMTTHHTLAHQQLYDFRFHLAKCELIVKEDYKNRRFDVIGEFLAAVPSDCPHHYFQDQRVLRASEAPLAFSKTQMIIRTKYNYANQLCQFVLQSVKDRRRRHQALQYFMLHNDTVTVATEVPVFLTSDDLEHLQSELGFFIYQRPTNKNAAAQLQPLDAKHYPPLITGHVDFLQIRNGQVHLLDYKPQADKERPIEQLTIYAMALSRQTGLRLYDFKCAWFDEQHYFEFFPLHVLHKPRKNSRRKNITTKEGIYQVNQQQTKINRLRPTGPSPKEVIH